MAAEQRKLLEQLMGESMMAMPGSGPKQPPVSITDPKVCRSYLCGSCPHDLFTNTRMDQGPCPKQHAVKLKEEFQSATVEQKQAWGFEYDYMRDMNRYVKDCDRRIEGANTRLEKTADEVRKEQALHEEMARLNKTIEAGLVEVEIIAEEGAVNMAVQDFFKVKQAKVQKQEREHDLKNLLETSGSSGHQKLQVCEVCGAFLSRLDNDRRLADHFFGKMHLGYAMMRKEIERLQKEFKTRPPPPVTRTPASGRDESRHSYDSYDTGYGGYTDHSGSRSRGYGRSGGGRRW